MKIRFGYVAIALDVPSGSPNKTITYSNLSKIAMEDRTKRLHRILRDNLETTLRILRYNAANQIHIYRLTSKLVPLATHSVNENWDYIAAEASLWQQIGDYIKKYNMRISAHPDHYTLLNSPRPEVLTSSLNDLAYHNRLLEAMELETTPSLVIHIGGHYKDKTSSLNRFEETFNNLPETIRNRLILENDDKTYTASEVLSLCEKIKCPMVLDIHHHRCNNNGENLSALWPRITATWNGKIPKIHVSSPKNEKDSRAHADYVNPLDLLPFLKLAKILNQDFDIMVEAKCKDLAMFKLIENLATEPGISRSELASIEL